MRSRYLLLTLLCIGVSAQEPSSAPQSKTDSQDVQTDFSDPLHPKTTVVVTATRSAEEVQKSSVSTSVVSRAELETRPAKTIDQNLTTVPGLFMQRTKGVADTIAKAELRGFSGPNRTLILLDGQPINNAYSGDVNWNALPIDEVQTVEVVRGPFSSLYGGNALGGVINVLTRPVDHRELELRGEYGSFGTSRYAARYSDRFFNRLAVTLGYQWLESEGYPSRASTVSAGSGTTGTLVTGAIPMTTNQGARVYQVGWAGTNWYNQRAYRVKGEYTPSASTIISVQYIRQRYGYGYYAYNSLLRDASGTIVDRGPFLFNDGGGVRQLSVTPYTFLQGPGGEANHFGSFSVQHKISSRQILRIDGGYYGSPEYNYRTLVSGDTASGGTGNYNLGVRHNAHGNVQYNLSLRRHSIVTGTETRHEMGSSSTYRMANWTLPETQHDQTYFALGRAITQSAYAQDQIAVGERLRVTLGGRYDYWKTYDGQSNSYSASAPLTFYDDRSRHSATGKAAVSYSLPQSWTLRASAGTAFRNPGINELFATSVLSGIIYRGNPALSPERVKSWEAGVRKQFGNRADFDVAYYENRISDLIYRKTDLVADPKGNDRINVNAGEGRTRGLEAATQERLLSWLQFRGTYTYSDAIITRNAANPATVGKRVLYVPEHMASGQLLGTKGKWTGSATARYVGSTFTLDTNTDTTKGVPGSYDSYFLMDLSLGYTINRHFQVYGTAENLLDRQYYLFYLCPGRSGTIGLRIRM